MRIHRLIRRFACALILLAAALSSGLEASAHPEDEMCAPGSGMDPELCRALAQIDNAEAPLTTEALLVDTDRTLTSNTMFFMKAGVGHILPGGLDHILFVLALFFAVRKFGPLALQISIFTLAHSASLALAAAGFVNVPGEVVEPLIAASIAFVALENIFFRSITAWRPFIIFGFGLLHGLGFAGFFLEQDLPNGLFWSSLIGFNIGVELGQLSVVLLAWPALNWFFKARWYRAAIVIPASLLIAGIGLWWAVERVAGAL